MSVWQSILRTDPVPALLLSGNTAVVLYTERELLGRKKSLTILKDRPEVRSILRKQQKNGGWKYPGGNKKIRTQENYDQIEAYRNLGYLIEMYGFDKSDPEIAKAAEFIFSFQTKAGDIRGILGNQYAPYYTAGFLELFIKAGYVDDKRILKAFKWLDSIRQDDGGWAIPLRTRGRKLDAIAMETETLEPDRSKPFSHLVTGVVLRAYAADKKFRKSAIAKRGGKLLLSNLFAKDNYPDRGSKEYWLKFTFPFWFTDLISAMDSLSLLGFSKEEPQVEKAVEWFVRNQRANGLWKLPTLKNKQIFDSELWLSVAICRILKRLDP